MSITGYSYNTAGPYWNGQYWTSPNQELILDDGEHDELGPTYALNPNDIQPYVAIGPTDDLNVTVHKSSFDRLVIAVMIVFLLFVIVTTIIFLVIARNHVRPQPLSDTIVTGPRLSVAKFNGFNIIPNLPNKKVHTTSIQADLHSASVWASQNAYRQPWSYHPEQQLAVIWEMTNSVRPPTDHEPQQMYSQEVSHRWFLNSVFLAEYPEAIPRSFWKYQDDSRFLYLTTDEVQYVTWKPRIVGGDPRLTGIYAAHPFTIKDVPLILNRPPQANCRIFSPPGEGGSATLELPDWPRYYICYVHV